MMDNQLIPPFENKEDIKEVSSPTLENNENLKIRTSFKKRLKEHLLKKSISSQIRDTTNYNGDKKDHNIKIHYNEIKDSRSMTPEVQILQHLAKKEKNKREMYYNKIQKGIKISVKLPPSFSPEINNRSRELASLPKKIRKYHQHQCLSVDSSHNPAIDRNSKEITRKFNPNKKEEEKSNEITIRSEKKIKSNEIFDPNCTFSPKIIPKEMNVPVIERFEEWIIKKNEKVKNIEDEIASRANNECPFKPDTTKEIINISPVKISMISVQKYFEKREYLFKKKQERINKTQSNSSLQNISIIKSIKLQPINLARIPSKNN